MHGKFSLPLTQQMEGAPEQDGIDLRQLQDFFWRRWKTIVATAITVMVLVFFVLLTVAPRYTGTAQVLLEPRKEKIFGADNILPELNLETSNVDSQVSVIQSINLLRRVVEKEKLTGDIEFGQPPRAGLLNFILGSFRSDDADRKAVEKTADGTIPPDVLRSIGRLRNALEVQRINRTYVLSISVTSEDPVKAARLANAVADMFVVDQLDARYDAAKRASIWLAERMEGLREQVRQSEEAVAQFRREHNLVATSSEAKVTISEQQLSELNGKLIAARADLAEKRAKYEQVAQIGGQGGNLQAIPDVVRSSVISSLRSQQAEVARKEADLLARYSEQHPQVVNARAERRDIERSIAAEVQRILTNLKNDYDVARAREESLQASLAKISGETGLDNSVGVRLRELERLNVGNKTLFDNFLSRAKITQEQSTFEEREARVISPATRPGAPSFPKTGLIEALAGALGLLLGVGGAVALDMLNAGFLTPREIEMKLGLPVLATVPILLEGDRKVDGKVVDPPRYLASKPLSRYAEAVRALRVGVQMADVDNPAKIVLVTSAIPNEGKSTLAVSLALSAEMAGQRVLLVDGDLRHPTMSKYFDLHSADGLVDFLTGKVSLEAALIERGGLTILPVGAKSQNPPDMLGSERMKFLIDSLRREFDYIVIDSPPLGPVIDAKVLTALIDKVVFVVRWRTTTRETVAQHLESFAQNRKIAGIAFNMVDETKTPRYGPYSHYSGYYYKKYYQN
ncbi:polysaccharide biosynthesis tyrosine autokinase [Methylosinus sp. RM1]|uniref:GumC family protein n=1 Tax=Methylosinus sp. RM1 TaxID=2583817 RepID=UPI00140A9B38|nr:polysaccharide biosynthesis tyrosine autokinase [Methylosinus sp. RM1]